jgi:hypothetical protein
MCGVQTFGHLGYFSRAQDRQLSLQNTSRTQLLKSELADDLKLPLIPNTQSFKNVWSANFWPFRVLFKGPEQAAWPAKHQ